MGDYDLELNPSMNQISALDKEGVVQTWRPRRHAGSCPGGAMTASSRDLVDVLPLQRCHQRWFSDVVGVAQTQLQAEPVPRIKS